MNEYELVLVLSPEVDLETLAATIDNMVTKHVTNSGGTVSSIDRWGKRRLAYPIKHFMEGIYVLARLQLKPASSRGLEASLRINEQVLRHLLVRAGS